MKMNNFELFLLDKFDATIEEVKDFEKLLIALAVVSLIVINELARLL